jgi:sensor histidine kinase YesM
MKVFSDYLCDKKKIFGTLATINSGLSILVSILVTIFTDLYFFDMWLLWAIFQGVSFILLTVGVGYNIKDYNLTRKIALPIFMISFITYILDTIFSCVGGFEETGFSQLSFIFIFLIAIIAILKSVPKNVNDAIKAKQLEAEKIALDSKLQESRILLMISQIQPHFLYNILNTIYHLCDKDIELAKKAVDDFSTYLRNNINSLSTTELIPFDTELEHIKTYINLEKIRFGEELNVVYDVQTSDFYLPILSIQPLVENAIKHGVSKKRGGGKVTISSYEDDLNYIISIIDTGVGYDLNQILSDGKSHIGIQNVKERLESRVDGTLILESEIGVGTKAIVYIPKKELK